MRRDLLDHVIVLNRKHLRRLLNEYVRYYHEDRTLGLGKDTPGVEWQRRRLRVNTRLSLYRDSVVYIIATQ